MSIYWFTFIDTVLFLYAYLGFSKASNTFHYALQEGVRCNCKRVVQCTLYAQWLWVLFAAAKLVRPAVKESFILWQAVSASKDSKTGQMWRKKNLKRTGLIKYCSIKSVDPRFSGLPVKMKWSTKQLQFFVMILMTMWTNHFHNSCTELYWGEQGSRISVISITP